MWIEKDNIIYDVWNTSIEWTNTGTAVEDVDLKTGTIWDNDGHLLPYDYENYHID